MTALQAAMEDMAEATAEAVMVEATAAEAATGTEGEAAMAEAVGMGDRRDDPETAN